MNEQTKKTKSEKIAERAEAKKDLRIFNDLIRRLKAKQVEVTITQTKS